MKSIDAIYKFGNLYDQITRKRILLEDGAKVSIAVNVENLLAVDPNLKPDKLLSSAEKEYEITNFIAKKGGKSWKLFDTGKLLYFEISAGTKGKNKVDRIRCLFQLQLLEDLYIYNKKPEPKYARFFDCHCLVESCIPNFEFFEPLYTTSLNDAYTKTYELYFAMFGKSTANAFDRFFEKADIKEPIRDITESIQQKPPLQ